MTRTGKAFLIFLISFLVCFDALAGLKVQSFADRKEMGLGDTLDVTVSVSSNESVSSDEPKLPDMPNFQILNAFTSSSTSSKLIQGARGMEFETLKTIEYHYQVSPKKEGTLSIPAFEVVVDGKSHRTSPFTVKVSGQSQDESDSGQGGSRQRPTDEQIDSAEDEIFNQLLQRRGAVPHNEVVPKNPNESFFIHLDLDKTEVYEGEQITANWYIYTRGNLVGLDRLKFPDLKGFWKEIIEEVPALNFTQEVLNGVSYRRALLASHALFPIKAGIAVVDEYKVKATMQLPSGPFGGFGMGQPYTYNRSSDRVKITVKPLPVDGKPRDFSGAVGLFDVRSSVDHNEVPINQPFSLKIRFEGEGNAKLIELPPMALPLGLENYDTKSDAKFFKNGRSYKEFEVLIIPREPGELEIPAISVSLFDPKTAKYYSRKTESIKMKVTGAKTEEPLAAGTTTQGKSGSTPSGPVKPQLPAILTHYDRVGSPLAAQVTWAGFALLSFMGLGWKARRELGRKEKKATIQELLKVRMKKVRKTLKSNDWREASVQMTNVIYSVLGGISGEGGASRELRFLLAKAPPSLRRDLGDELAKTVDLFQLLTFGPEETIGALKEPKALEKEIDRTEKLLVQAIDHVDSSEK